MHPTPRFRQRSILLGLALASCVALIAYGLDPAVPTSDAAPHSEHNHAHPQAQSDTTEAPSERPTVAPDLIGLGVTTVEGDVLRLGLGERVSPVALVFLDDGCTISRRYVQRLNTLGSLAREVGVDLYAVISHPAISFAEAKSFRDDFALEIPLLFDANGDIAHQVSPQIVPSAFVIDLDGRITYSGRIDDRFPSLTKIRREARTHDLLNAIEAIASDSGVPAVRTQAVGCVFTPWPPPPRVPTYTQNIAPILNANCVECHHDGGVGPFSLDTYADAKRWATMSVAVTRAGLMPPWRAARDVGHFREERFLTDRQIELLAAWNDTDVSQGDPEASIPAPVFAHREWPLGEPDLVLTMPEPYSVPADGEDIYRYIVVPMETARDAVVVAMDFQPGDSTVVHHCNYFIDYSGRGRQLDAKDPAPGFSVFGTGGFMSYDGPTALGAWAPGVAPYELPKGYGFDLPRGGDIVLEMHYHLSGKATTDQSSLAFYFADGPVKRGISALMIGTQDLDIPADDARYWRRVTMEVPDAMQLIDIAPHMHYLGREARITATLPDGSVRPLLHVTDWDLRWQGIYSYRRPVEIPAGSQIEALFRFDNSSGNPNNVNEPPEPVRWGWGSDEEMAELYLTIIPENARADARLQRAARASWMRSADPGDTEHLATPQRSNKVAKTGARQSP